jgi:aspartyl protease family protein
VNFLVDTGASLVAVDEKLGPRLGLERGAAWSVQTANGVVRGWRTLIASLNVAGIEQRGVPAILLPALGEQVLLGMSFLKRVELVQRDDTLRLRQAAD